MKKVLRVFSVLILALICLSGWFSFLDAGEETAQAAPSVSLIDQQPIVTSTWHTGHSLSQVGSDVFMFGGSTASGVTADLWRFDSTTQRWVRVPVGPGARPPSRQGHASAVLDNRLYIFGGENGRGEKKDDVWRYDPATGKWSEVPQETRPPARSGHTATTANNQFLFQGGTMSGQWQSSAVWVYDPATGYWTTRNTPNPVGQRRGQSSGMLGSQWLLVGGEGTTEDTFLQSVDLYSHEFANVPVTQTARPRPRKNQATAFDRSKQTLFIFGGEDLSSGRTITDTWRFSMKSRYWTRMADLPVAMSGAQAAYVTTTYSSRPPGFLPGADEEFRILIAGGQDAAGIPLTHSYLFDGVEYVTATADAVYGVQISPLAINQAGQPGASVVYSLQITNTGDITDTFTLTATGNAWTTILAPSVGPLPAGLGQSVTVTVQVPPALPGSVVTDTVHIQAISQSDPARLAASVLTTGIQSESEHRIFSPLITKIFTLLAKTKLNIEALRVWR